MVPRGLRFGIALLLMVGSAHARTTRGARLVWARGAGADSCVGAAGLEEDVKRRLGYDPFALAGELFIEGTIARTQTGYRAELTMRDAEGKLVGKRKLEARSDGDCRVVGEAVGLAVTVAIDPDAPLAAPAPPDTREIVERAPDKPESNPAPPHADRTRLRGEAVVAGGVSAGLVPGASAAVSLLVEVPLTDYVGAGFGARMLPESRTGDFGFGLASVDARACVLPWRWNGIARFCGGALVGLFEVYVHGQDVAPIDVGAFPWFALHADAIVSVPVADRIRLEGAGSLVAPIARQRAFVRGDPEPVWEQGALGGIVEVGVRAVF